MAQAIFCHELKQTVDFFLVLPVSWQVPPCHALCSCLQGSGLALPGRDWFGWHQSLGSFCPAHQHQPRAEQGAGSFWSSALSFKWGVKPGVGSWPRPPVPPQRGSWAGSVCLPIPMAQAHGLGIQLGHCERASKSGFLQGILYSQPLTLVVSVVISYC